MDESSTDGVKCHRNLASGRKVASAIRIRRVFSFNVKGCYILTYSSLFYCIVVKQCYGGRRILELLGSRRIDRVPNAGIRELCGVPEGVNEWIDESVLR